MAENDVTTRISDQTVSFEKTFDSPRELVFEVWTSPEHLAEWWGPDGFTLTTQSMDFSNGGFWNFIMHGPDGMDFENKIQFIEIDPPNSITYKQQGGGETEDIQFQTKVLFTEVENGTNVTIEMKFPTKEALERVAREYGAIEGGEQHITRLGKYIESLK